MVTEPLRPDMSSAPPRAERQTTAQTNDEEGGFGGSGGEGTTATAAEEENGKLRAELEKLNAEFTRSREAQELSAERIQELQGTMVSLDDDRRADAQQKARQEEARLQALQNARDGLARLRKDQLYDSSLYANAIEYARFELARAVELNPDAASTSAQREVERARDAFSNSDLDRMFRHANAAIVEINRAAVTTR